MKEREYWVDNVKLFACILVMLGHFFQSMVKASIINDGIVLEWFDTTIYYFHVPLFFVCSGYLYQKYSKVNDFSSWFKNIRKKLLVLGVPYFVFSTVTWVIKYFFVMGNNQIGGLFESLFLFPYPPYWYLYCLFFIFFITPTFSYKGKWCVYFVISLVLNILGSLGIKTDIYFIDIVMTNEVWFLIGMYIPYVKMKKEVLLPGSIIFILFLIMTGFLYGFDITFAGMDLILGVGLCVGVVLIFKNTTKSIWLSQYTMSIFLMHTIFAAGIRVVLLKVGVMTPIIHIGIGIGFSILGPVLAEMLLRKIKYADFIIYPNKYIKL